MCCLIDLFIRAYICTHGGCLGEPSAAPESFESRSHAAAVVSADSWRFFATSILHGSFPRQSFQNAGEVLLHPRRTCGAVVREFKEHHSRLRMHSEAKANSRWPEVFGTSPWFEPSSNWLLVWRLLVTALFVAVYIWSVATNWQDGYWFIYLTHWSLTIETLYFMFASYTAYVALQKLREGSDGGRRPVSLPWFVKATWVLNHIAMPASLLVCLLYWTTVNPPWNLQQTPDLQCLFVHGFNFVLCLADLFL
eukprot:TRINITY_DN32854_c0_g1_i6.p1 TRINITY_DN32854_c0_g1~~TRINITY_DN32854_c0_g1_i6.p1  ORF type:complete len:251 (-),score=27.88 TRINITY_DN32854_c0_g1_i6:1073-1825(-)